VGHETTRLQAGYVRIRDRPGDDSNQGGTVATKFA